MLLVVWCKPWGTGIVYTHLRFSSDERGKIEIPWYLLISIYFIFIFSRNKYYLEGYLDFLPSHEKRPLSSYYHRSYEFLGHIQTMYPASCSLRQHTICSKCQIGCLSWSRSCQKISQAIPAGSRGPCTGLERYFEYDFGKTLFLSLNSMFERW